MSWGICVWCKKPSNTKDRSCSAPDGDGHLFERNKPMNILHVLEYRVIWVHLPRKSTGHERLEVIIQYGEAGWTHAESTNDCIFIDDTEHETYAMKFTKE